METPGSTVVLIHGSRHDGWCWHLVQEQLSALGITSVAPDLPFTSMADDLDVVREVVADLPGRVTLVGHSRSGRLLSSLIELAPKVNHLVYLAAFLLEEGEVFPPKRRPTKMTQFQAGGDQLLEFPLARDIFYHDCEEELALAAWKRLRTVPLTSKFQPVTSRAAWRAIPSTYIVCSDDHCIHPDDQRDMSVHAGAVYEISSSHSPFLSRPKELAELIVRSNESATLKHSAPPEPFGS